MTTKSLNLTDLDLSWQDPYNLVQESMALKITLTSLIIFVLIFGTVCYISLTIYERYGEDSQKRQLVNQVLGAGLGRVDHGFTLDFQLISNICVLTLIMYWLNTPLLLWRILVSPVIGKFWWFWWSLSTFYAYADGLAGLEITLVKFYLSRNTRLPAKDDFLAKFLAITNLVIGSLFGLVNCYTEEGFQSELRSSGLPPLMSNYTKLQPR